MPRPLYRVDKDNNLAFKYPQDKSYKSIPGVFKVDSSNRLIYEIDKKDNWDITEDLGDKVVLEGQWQLDRDHNLKLYIKREGDKRKRSLKLRGRILKLDSYSLLFEIKSRPDYKVSRIAAITLSGSWSRDRFNRLIFSLKSKADSGELLFRKNWKLSKSKEIIYSYSKIGLKKEQSLLIKGCFEIGSQKKISYRLNKSDSSLSFLANIETPNLYPKKAVIKYRVGIGFKDKREERLILFKGNWKISSDRELIFEVDKGGGGIRRYYFSYSFKVSKEKKIIFTVFNNKLEPLGLSLSFRSGDLERDNIQYFLKLSRKAKEERIDIGLKRGV
jgi:hypothetical protein